MRPTRLALPVVLGLAGLLLLTVPRAEAADPPEKAPGEAKPGEVTLWHAADGLAYLYRLPKDWDPERGATLTFVLHGSNLDRRWGFANHAAKSFRPDDLVVCPDGTTSNGQGGFNFLGQPKDVARFHALLEELRTFSKAPRVYLYGHSQGSFFALHYAGEQPEDVDGVVAHASGVWTWTQGGKKGHHQAIVLMHGTQDPVVPYGQSVGGLAWLRERKYPVARLFSLEGWNHWPAEHNGDVPHTSQELAFCEGMTSTDPARLRQVFDYLADVKVKERHDWAGLWRVASRLETLEESPADLKEDAQGAREAVEALAEAHAAALSIDPTDELEKEDWVGHLPVFLRAFDGVPACDALRARWAKVLEKQEKAVAKHFPDYWKAVQKGDQAAAFEAGVEALEGAFLQPAVWDRSFLGNLETWRKDAKALKLSKKVQKTYDALSKDLADAIRDGYRAFERIQRKAQAP